MLRNFRSIYTEQNAFALLYVCNCVFVCSISCTIIFFLLAICYKSMKKSLEIKSIAYRIKSVYNCKILALDARKKNDKKIHYFYHSHDSVSGGAK